MLLPNKVVVKTSITSIPPYRPDTDVAYHTDKSAGRELRVVFIPWEAGTPEAQEWTEKTNQWNEVKQDKFTIVYYSPHQTDNVHLLNASNCANSVIYIRGHGSPGANSLKTSNGDAQVSLAIEEVCTRLVGMGLKTQFRGAIKFHSCYSGCVYAENVYSQKRKEAEHNLAEARDNISRMSERNAKELGGLKQQIDAYEQGSVSSFFWSRLLATDEDLAREKNSYRRRVERRDQLIKSTTPEGEPARFIRERELRIPQLTSLARQGASFMRSLGFDNCEYFGYLGPMEAKYALTVDTTPGGKHEYHKYVSLESLCERPSTLEAQARVRASAARVRILFP